MLSSVIIVYCEQDILGECTDSSVSIVDKIVKSEEDDKTKVPVVIASSQVSDKEYQTAPVGLGKIMHEFN